MMDRCPLGTCNRCDALTRAELDARCPNRPKETLDGFFGFVIGSVVGFLTAMLVFALTIP